MAKEKREQYLTTSVDSPTKKSNQASGLMDHDWKNMTEDERKAASMLGTLDESPEQITHKVLKLCNVIREVREGEQTSFMKKRSGIGGTGGRKLSPELRFRFGTYGFKNSQRQQQILGTVKLDKPANRLKMIPMITNKRK